MEKYIDEINRILNPHARDIEPAAGDHGLIVGHVKGVDKAKRQVTGTLSTPSVDRYGEVVLPKAFEPTIDQFRSNPKFLAAHLWTSPDGMPKSIGHWLDIDISDGEVVGTAQFLDAGDELTDAWWRRFEQGAVKTFSVGFLARKFEMRKIDIGGEKRNVRHFTEADLVEVSAVEIPANPDAMVREYSAQIRSSIAVAWGEADDVAAFYNKISQHVEDVIKQQLLKVLTDPVGPMDSMMREIVATVLAAGPQGHDHDHHEAKVESLTDEIKGIFPTQ